MDTTLLWRNTTEMFWFIVNSPYSEFWCNEILFLWQIATLQPLANGMLNTPLVYVCTCMSVSPLASLYSLLNVFSPLHSHSSLFSFSLFSVFISLNLPPSLFPSFPPLYLTLSSLSLFLSLSLPLLSLFSFLPPLSISLSQSHSLSLSYRAYCFPS